VHAVHPVEQGHQGRLTSRPDSVVHPMRDAISTPNAPAAIGPYSQAIRAGDFLFVSGQIPLNPATGTLVEGGIREQTDRVLQNLDAILSAAGSSMASVVKTTVYLKDMAEFSEMNEVYGRFFPAPAPARATIQAARLPRDVRVEIDLVAYVRES
jgi:2-iminobutanoate/2-iminopropanoate deaminase